MKMIGNIVYVDELVNHTKVDYINYYYNTFEEIDYNLPTLFVGWMYYKESYAFSDMASILEKKIIQNQFYWEFSYSENKIQHISGVENFIKNLPHYYYSPKYQYTNLDPVMFNISGETELLEIIPRHFDILYNYKNEMLFLFYENKIIGIDLIMYSYFDFDIVSIINFLNSYSSTKIVDIDGEIYQDFYKIFPNFDNLKRYVGLLMSNS